MAKLLAHISFPKSRGTIPMSVVLHRTDQGQWATHLRDDTNQSLFWGHYFNDSVKAQMDYLDRAEAMVKTYEAQGLKPISRVG